MIWLSVMLKKGQRTPRHPHAAPQLLQQIPIDPKKVVRVPIHPYHLGIAYALVGCFFGSLSSVCFQALRGYAWHPSSASGALSLIGELLCKIGGLISGSLHEGSY